MTQSGRPVNVATTPERNVKVEALLMQACRNRNDSISRELGHNVLMMIYDPLCVSGLSSHDGRLDHSVLRIDVRKRESSHKFLENCSVDPASFFARVVTDKEKMDFLLLGSNKSLDGGSTRDHRY